MDFTEICRTCLNESKLMQTIFEVKLSEVHNVRLIDFIRRLTSIKVRYYFCFSLFFHILIVGRKIG